MEELDRKQDVLEQVHGVGHFDRWDYDADLGTLTFSNRDNENVLIANYTSIGTYSLKTGTWLWAWANESYTEPERGKMAKLMKLHELTGQSRFLKPHFKCSEETAWTLAAAAVHHLDSMGCYRAPAEHLLIFMSIDSVQSVSAK